MVVAAIVSSIVNEFGICCYSPRLCTINEHYIGTVVVNYVIYKCVGICARTNCPFFVYASIRAVSSDIVDYDTVLVTSGLHSKLSSSDDDALPAIECSVIVPLQW